MCTAPLLLDTESAVARQHQPARGVRRATGLELDRSLAEPVLQYLDAVREGDPNHMVTVIIPESVPARWWHALPHRQPALVLKLLLFRRNVTVTNVRSYPGRQRLSR